VERSHASPLLEFTPTDRRGLLVSSYDLAHRLLAVGDDFDANWVASRLSRPELLIVDSGGYETSAHVAVEELDTQEVGRRGWTEADYAALLGRFPAEATNVAGVSFDKDEPPYNERSYDDQIAHAQEFFARYPHLVSICLLKPEPRRRTHDIERLAGLASRLNAFDVLGLTDKELGSSLRERIVTVMRFREVLDNAGIPKPIHVFGALDPLFVPLYFAAGADVFDGLTWLRYGFWHGLVLHREARALIEGKLDLKDDAREYALLVDNLAAVDQLERQMTQFVEYGGDWGAYADTVAKDGRHLGLVLQDIYRQAWAGRRR
jgi:hypothetical protein